MTELRQRDSIEVERDGERVTVYNWVNLDQPVMIRSGGDLVERFNAKVYAGDSAMSPDAITHWVAQKIDMDYVADLETQGIEVIDVESDEVIVL